MKNTSKVLIFFSFISLVLMILISCNPSGPEIRNNPSGPEIRNNPSGMVKVPAKGKTFSMGDSSYVNTMPVHQVTLTYDYWMDTVEVTQGQYKSLMAKTYSDFSAPSWNNYGFGDNYPVYHVSWFDAALYCNARTRGTGSIDTVYSYTSIHGFPGNNCSLNDLNIDLGKSGFRLPTEAEWEYACRAGTITDFYWGKNYGSYPASVADSNEINTYAGWRGNSSQESSNTRYGTHPVGSKKKNGFGLYDMSGNVWEWCNDFCGDYNADSLTDPVGPQIGDYYRVIRGGSWTNDAISLRSASRYSGPEEMINDVGFRVCLPVQ